MHLVDKYYEDYGSRARELRAQGQRFLGYLCAYVPLEIVAAAGFVPVRIKGSVYEPISAANTNMETIVCPVVRSCYDMVLKGKYDYIEGMIIPHSCDSMYITHDIWRSTLNLPYFHIVNVPHTADAAALEFFTSSLRTFRTSLERYTGSAISDDAIAAQIDKYNQYRVAVRELYQIRLQNNPPLSGADTARTLVAGMSLPVEEATSLVRSVIAETEKPPPSSHSERPRIMICGSEQDDDVFCRIVEETGATVVSDFLCPGLREYGTDVAIGADPVAALAKRYLDLYCARTYREHIGSPEKDLEDRFGTIGRLVKDYRVDGVIIRLHRFCDPYGMEMPALRAYLQSLGVPEFYLEDDYSMRDTGRLQTRIQAFIEIIGQRRDEGVSDG